MGKEIGDIEGGNKAETRQEIQAAPETVKQAIRRLLGDDYFKKTVDANRLKELEDMAAQSDGDPKELDLNYQGEQARFDRIKAVKERIAGHVKQAIQDKAIKEEDRKFYRDKMYENVVNGKQNVTPEMVEKAEKEVLESLGKRRAEKKVFDLISKSPFHQEGFIAGSAQKIKIPADESAFLALSVHDRKQWAGEVMAIKGVGEYLEHQNLKECDGIRDEIKKLTDDPYFRKTLDPETLKGYLDLVDKKGHISPGDADSLKKFHKFMKEQYGEILTVKNRITGHMEKAVKEGVITEKDREAIRKDMHERVVNGKQIVTKEILEKEEKKIMEDLARRRVSKLKTPGGPESVKNVGEYQKKLDGAREKKIISKHTHQAFLEDIKKQTPERQKEYLKDFDKQMARYIELRKGIDGLKDTQVKNTLNEMYESENCGYTEINAKFHSLNPKTITGASAKSRKAEEALLRAKNPLVQETIREMDANLDKTQKASFLTKLTDYLRGKTAENEDKETFEQSIQRARLSHQMRHSADMTDDEVEKRMAAGKEKEREDAKATKKGEVTVQKTQSQPTEAGELKAKRNLGNTYEALRYEGPKGKTGRVVKLDFSRKGVGKPSDAIDSFIADRSGPLITDSRTRITLVAGQGENKVEMKLEQMRALRDYLEETSKSPTANQDREKEVMQKAA